MVCSGRDGGNKSRGWPSLILSDAAQEPGHQTTLSRGTGSLDKSTWCTYRKKMKSNPDNYMSFCLRSFLCHLLGRFLNKIKVEDMKVNGRKSNLSLLNNIFFWREKKNYNYLDIGKAFAILFCRKLPFKSACAMHSTTMPWAVIWPVHQDYRLYWRGRIVLRGFCTRQHWKQWPWTVLVQRLR